MIQTLRAAAQTNRGKKRSHKPNEDFPYFKDGEVLEIPCGLYVVADGMGGHASGGDASKLAIRKLRDFIMGDLEEAIRKVACARLLIDGVQAANKAVHNRNMQDHADMGTTITAALIVGLTAYIVNVGDSRTYLYRKGEGLRQVTRDHSVVASLVEAGIIQPDDIYTHPKRNNIYRSLGEKLEVEIEPFEETLQPGDKLLLCSDGLWDMVRDPQIEAILADPSFAPEQTCQRLTQAALDGGGEDNISVIVVFVQ